MLSGAPASATGQSTISRYACRIGVERAPPHTARLYAAGFDAARRIFLGEKATKWRCERGHLDGVTTNGVLLMHAAAGGFASGGAQPPEAGEWMEVSVGGAVFSLDENRLAPCLNKKASSHLASVSSF